MESSHISALKTKHAGIEAQLHDELNRPEPDAAIIQTLKKKKLRIKEELSAQ
ncbi:YdcH family protein [Pontixanthobacter sp.]|uniref:YdcH family protein n=1 Tax=Pontixanthobacter sp. TaxID=2792078 RepID=UPI003C7DFA0B